MRVGYWGWGGSLPGVFGGVEPANFPTAREGGVSVCRAEDGSGGMGLRLEFDIGESSLEWNGKTHYPSPPTPDSTH